MNVDRAQIRAFAKKENGILEEDMMGTNFYWKDKVCDGIDKISPEVHIGKRSGKGLFCWTCGISMFSINEVKHTECPSCKTPVPNLFEINENSSIRYSTSFTWTKLSHKWKIESLSKEEIYSNKKVIIDEYEREYTAKEFIDNEIKNMISSTVLYAEFS